jgi:SRSO17 transposase
MTDEQIRDLGPAFAEYLQTFHAFCNQHRTTPHLDAYGHALLSNATRKTVEPTALASGIAVRTLQQFLTTTQWDHHGVRNHFQTRLSDHLNTLPSHDRLGTVGVIDETSCRKKGDQTPGVQRQYLGCVGKVDNGLVTVHLAVTRGSFRTLVDADVYLPQCWDDDERRAKAEIPADKVYRPKWWIALEQYERAGTNGLTFDWLTFDEGYGSKPVFVSVLALNRQKFAGEIPVSFAIDGRGGKSRRVDAVLPVTQAKRGRRYRLARETQPAQVWRAAGKSVSVNGLPMTLVVAWNTTTEEVKYFLAWGTRSVRRVLRVGFRRWTVEHLFRVAKQEVGLMHYEGRKYVGLLRHLILCVVVLGFVAEQTARLRGEKPSGDAGAGERSVECGVRGGAAIVVGGVSVVEAGRPGDSVSSTTQHDRERLAPKATA